MSGISKKIRMLRREGFNVLNSFSDIDWYNEIKVIPYYKVEIHDLILTLTPEEVKLSNIREIRQNRINYLKREKMRRTKFRFNKTHPVIPSITMSGKTYKLYKGDYIMDNGSCFQLCAGDGRALRRSGYNSYAHIKLTKKAISELPLDKMKKHIWENSHINYYF